MGLAWLFGLAAALGCGLTCGIWRLAEARSVHDVPNDRSMHKKRLAIGAGWAIVVTVATLWPWTSAPMPAGRLALFLAVLAMLAVVSWIDDLRPLPPLLRLIVQTLVVVVISKTQLPAGAQVLGGLLPPWLDRVALCLGWLWFINLYNFMDGIDGITGTETICVALGYVVVIGWLGATGTQQSLAVILAGSALGFLVWNWHPARIILGDVGSVPLGFLVGWLMLDLALRGHLAAALILPLHHIADASFTLVRRYLTVPQPWRPHRQHCYQRAVLGGLAVPQVVLRIATLNVVLVALAVLSIEQPWPALALAVPATAALLIHLGRQSVGDVARKQP